MLFIYKIADQAGKITTGQIEASSNNEARARLASQNGTVLNLVEAKAKTSITKAEFTFGRVKLIDKMVFAKHLAIMIKAGMPLDEGLETLMVQSSAAMSAKIKVILADVRQGNSLSSALRKIPKVFDSMFVNMVMAGEAGGKLEQNLEIVAVQQAKNYTLRSKIKAAMMYPTVVFFAIIGLIGVISAFVLPKLLGFFTTLHAKLPISTRILLASSQFLVKYWAWILIFIIALVITVKVMGKFAKTRLIIHQIILKIPIFGKIGRNLNLAIFCRSLSSLLNSGVTIDQALHIVADTVTNDVYKQRITLVYHQVLQGLAMSDILAKDKHFPILLSRMARVGERSGKLSETLDYLADFYETEVDNVTKNLSTMLEPALLVFIGLVVGFVAMSIINPIYELTSKVGS